MRLDFFDQETVAEFRKNLYSHFVLQKFSRAELARWLSVIGKSSVYQFVPGEVDPAKILVGRWPWGDYHTDLLGHLEAAAKRFWVNYDPAVPSTANTNATVSEWLQAERKVSKTMADAIASILRADGLPTGPRK